MLISRNWLARHIDFHDFVENNDILNTLNLIGFEVDDSYEKKSSTEGLIIALLQSVKKIEGSKKLNLCEVYDGKETLQVVCGGPDLKEKNNYIFAPVGSKVGDLNIKKRTVFDVESNGMICSHSEVGLLCQEEMSRVENTIAPGTKLENLFNLNDFIIKISISPNRGDVLCARGLALELCSAGLGNMKKISLNNFTQKIENNIEITNEIKKDDCQVFWGTVVRNISAITPLYIKFLLSSLEKTSRTLPVDITNFVLTDLGQPLHAYDLRTIEMSKLCYSTNEQTLNGLNGHSYKLNENTMILETTLNNQSCVAAMLGVLGGQETSCKYDTTDILLESTSFDHGKILKTSLEYKINTDSSYRFARYVHACSAYEGMNYALKLFNQIDSNILISNSKNYIVETEKSCNTSYESTKLFLSYRKFYDYTKEALTLDKQKEILEKLGFQVAMINKPTEGLNQEYGLEVIVPYYRYYDITTEECLIEEIIRMSNINKIEETPISNDMLNINEHEDSWKIKAKILNFMCLNAYDEVINLIFTDAHSNKISSFSSSIKPIGISNPIVTYQDQLRVSLIPQMLQNIDNNKHFSKGMNIFQLQETFFNNTHILNLAAVQYGFSIYDHWMHKNTHQNIFIAKQQIVNLFSLFDINIEFNNDCNVEIFNSSNSGSIILDNIAVGHIGLIKEEFSNNNYCLAWEIYDILNIFTKTNQKKVKKRKMSQFPIVELDLSFFLNQQDFNISNLYNLLYENFFHIISIKTIDVYQKENELSYTIRILLQKENGTFTSEEIQKNYNDITNIIKKNFNFIIR